MPLWAFPDSTLRSSYHGGVVQAWPLRAVQTAAFASNLLPLHDWWVGGLWLCSRALL